MPRFDLLITDLLLKLCDSSFISGAINPSEHAVKSLIKYYPEDFADYMSQIIDDDKYSFILADVLSCVGCICEDVWVEELLKKALSHKDVEVRDIAVQLLLKRKV